jgi:hypothetical protein
MQVSLQRWLGTDVCPCETLVDPYERLVDPCGILGEMYKDRVM